MVDTQVNHFDRLPNDLIVEILNRVGEKDSKSLFKSKMVCRTFRLAADDNFIYRNISLDGWPLSPWRLTISHTMFINRCFQLRNPNVLFRMGLVEYFAPDKNPQLGLSFLKEAYKAGQVQAVYVYGLIMFSHQEVDSNTIGLQILNQQFSKKPLEVVQVRKKAQSLVRQTAWELNRRPFYVIDKKCQQKDHIGYNPHRHGFEVCQPDCMTCYWCYELGFFASRIGVAKYYVDV